MRVLLPLPVVLPLVAAALSAALHGRLRAQQRLGVLTSAASLTAAIALLVRVDADGIAAVQMGDWPAPLGITLVADLFSAIMLVVSMAMVLGVLVFSLGQVDADRQRLYFHPLYLTLTAGVAASFLTGDLFNLFVAFEVMLTSSYALLVLGGSRAQMRSGMIYVIISLLASSLFVTAVAFTYAATGTVNLADLAPRIAELAPGLRTALSLLWLCVFGIKAGIFPLFFWLPDSYPSAPTPVTALFAGLLTKVGVYALIRTQTLLFGGDAPSGLLLAIAAATMVVGALGAIAQQDVKRLLSFLIVSHIGYMIFGLGLFTVAGLTGAILYIVHHVVVQTGLFLVAGMVETRAGTARLDRLSGLLSRSPLSAALFGLAGLSLAGLPPFSGFVAKLALIQAGLAQQRWPIVGVALAVSLLTLFALSKVWGGAFWGPVTTAPAGGAGTEAPPAAAAAAREQAAPVPRSMRAAATAVVGLSLVIAVAAGPLASLSGRAAADLIDSSRYRTAVLGPEAVAR